MGSGCSAATPPSPTHAGQSPPCSPPQPPQTTDLWGADLEAALADAKEAAKKLAVRSIRDKAAGRNAGWYEGRSEAQRFVGLFNEGATCYLNSLLQALFTIDSVRGEIYAFEYAGTAVHGSAESCVPLQLARLFARLEASCCQALSTRALTASFGWSRAESFQQHGSQQYSQPSLQDTHVHAYTWGGQYRHASYIHTHVHHASNIHAHMQRTCVRTYIHACRCPGALPRTLQRTLQVRCRDRATLRRNPHLDPQVPPVRPPLYAARGLLRSLG